MAAAVTNWQTQPKAIRLMVSTADKPAEADLL
jgi:hypothetical protein